MDAVGRHGQRNRGSGDGTRRSDFGDLVDVVCGFFEFRNRNAWPLLDSLPDAIVLDYKGFISKYCLQRRRLSLKKSPEGS